MRKINAVLYTLTILLCMGAIAGQWLIKSEILLPSAVMGGENRTVLSESSLYKAETKVELSVSDENAEILLNGAVVNERVTKRSFILFVRAGDVCQLDARNCDGGVTAYIRSVGEGLSVPAKDDKLAIKTGVRVLFVAKEENSE